jgi:hypothetical protein
MEKNVVYPFNGVQFGNARKQAINIQSNKEEFQNHHANEKNKRAHAA